MATTRRAEDGDVDAPGSAAAVLSDAGFVHVVAHADGGSIAGAGLLAGVLRSADRPYQVSVTRTRAEAARRVRGADADAATVGVGVEHGDVALAASDAVDAADALGCVDDALAAVAAVASSGDASGAVDRLSGERRPGVAVATADLADGLAHSTRLHASFSGDEDATRAALADLDLPADLDRAARRRVASLVALDASAGSERAPEAAADALYPHPLPGGPFATVEGYADVLDALARSEPGTAVALALGNDVRDTALEAYREHARVAHRAVREAELARYSGVVLADVPGAAWTVARLLRDFRAPEPAALVSGDQSVALATTDADARAVLGGVADDDVGGAERLASVPRVDAPAGLEEEVRAQL